MLAEFPGSVGGLYVQYVIIITICLHTNVLYQRTYIVIHSVLSFYTLSHHYLLVIVMLD